MNDSNVVLHKRSAMIIDLKMYVRSHYSKIRNSLVSGEWIHADMRHKLARRMKHCYRITHHIARMDHATYQFNLDSTKHYGDPLRDFLPSWALCEDKLIASLGMDHDLSLINPPTFIPVDNRLIVQ